MKMHELKTINPYFSDIWEGKKYFEIRKDDRGFREGDILKLQEYNPATSNYSGRYIIAVVSYLLPANTFEGLAPDYCCMDLIIRERKGRRNKQ